jgi:hypothetical protein
MAEIWPSTLPECPLPHESAEALGNNVLEFAPEVGPAYRRQRYSTAWDSVTLTYKMTHAETQLFRAFYRVSLGHGSINVILPFDPFTRESHEYQIKSQPSFQRISSDAYRVSFDALRKPL